jgi:hypothetical protein
MGALSSAKFARLARKISVAWSVRPVFLRDGQPPNNLEEPNLGSLRVAVHGPVSVWPFARNGSRAVGRAAPRAALGAGAPLKEELTMPAGAATEFGRWFMMERARPEMGLAGQGNGFAGRPLRPASRKISGIAFENHANLDRAALCEITPMQFCLMVR